MDEITVVMHAGAFGASQYDDALDTALRAIADAASSDPKGEWSAKYGTAFENETFMMHPYCGCERDDCRWCSEDACGCEHRMPWYEWDGERVTWDQVQNKLGDYPKPYEARWEYGTPGHAAATRLFDEAMTFRDAHLKQWWPERIHTCEPRGLMGDRAQGDTWLPPQSAPNFWHKPGGFRVWWYKYIGRDVEIVGVAPPDLRTQCVASLAKTTTVRCGRSGQGGTT